MKADHFDVSFRSLFDHLVEQTRWALIYVDESWLLWRELLSSLYDYSAERTKWALIYVFATYVNRSENRNWSIYCVAQMCMYAKAESCLCNDCVNVVYSCSACAKTLLSFCVYEQRLCRVFAVYVLTMHVNWPDNAKNRSIYCITWACRCTKAESCLRSVYVCDVYELQHVRKDVAVVLCIWAKTVSCFRSVCDCDACTSIW